MHRQTCKSPVNRKNCGLPAQWWAAIVAVARKCFNFRGSPASDTARVEFHYTSSFAPANPNQIPAEETVPDKKKSPSFTSLKLSTCQITRCKGCLLMKTSIKKIYINSGYDRNLCSILSHHWEASKISWYDPLEFNKNMISVEITNIVSISCIHVLTTYCTCLYCTECSF